ncbi:PX domain-containing protein EREL1-like isoform X3 [Cynara cardunculus var. scolymus]|uniref:PX domain-containing protein EREL1-like isoform X3 n=1 Tax=Cynara cardunculus var. scolymus TaxID=59895 RepID=UPI000D630B4C|nr:PX domain-containing protein EREL1-like isoform X3 [Cynara cardunculus var. scolymus]
MNILKVYFICNAIDRPHSHFSFLQEYPCSILVAPLFRWFIKNDSNVSAALLKAISSHIFCLRMGGIQFGHMILAQDGVTASQSQPGLSFRNLETQTLLWVQVGLQSPEGVTTTRAVLRRFNDFLKLLAALRKAFPKKNLPPAPPKGLLRLKSRTLLEERRGSLEEWMTKLLSDIDISRSIVVASFLELVSAARSSFQDENQQIGQGKSNTASPRIHPDSNESVASGSTPLTPDYGSDTAYETSEIGTSSLGRDNISEAGTEDLSLDEDLTGPLEKLVKHAYLTRDRGDSLPRQEQEHGKFIGNSEKLSNGSVGKTTSSLRRSVTVDTEFPSSLADSYLIPSRAAEVSKPVGFLGNMESDDINLVLPLGQQQKMNRVLISMQRRLGTAKTDMEDLISRLNQEIAVKDYLTTKVKDLEEELETTKLRSKENLHQAILMERERVTQMQWDMEELRRRSLEMEFKLKSQQDDKQETESPKTSIIEEKDQLLQELDDTKSKLEQLLKKHQELEIKSKADVKVLVKEVKSLRSSQAELKQQLNQSVVGKLDAEKLLQQEKQKYENDNVARRELLHECDVLQHRLRECSMNLLNESEDKLVIDSPSVQDALELVKISDDRIEALLAQAQILGQDDDVSSGDYELRKMVSEILVDNISLRKQVSLLVHRALKVGIVTTKDMEAPCVKNKTLDTR